jgi:hypothetical protein
LKKTTQNSKEKQLTQNEKIMYCKKAKKRTMLSPELSIPQENNTPAQARSIFSPNKNLQTEKKSCKL